MSDDLEPVRERLRQMARELAWLPERAAVIARELTAIEARLVEAGAAAPIGLTGLWALRLALHRVIAEHVEPAVAVLQAAAGEAPEDAA